MSVNTNNTEKLATEQESGASGAPNAVSAPVGTYVQSPRVAHHWATIKRGTLQGTLKEAAITLERLLTRCHVEGPHKVFRWTLNDPKNEANDAAVLLILCLVLQVADQLGEAKQQHVDILRHELEAYEAHQGQTS